MARSVSENKGFNVGQKDYLQLSELEGVSGKRKFYVYYMGFSDKGYLDMCRFCRGGNNINTCYIPTAEQDSYK